MSISQKRHYVPDSKRDLPQPGDMLLLIDGQQPPLGEVGEDGERWDHTKTYRLLEEAGQHDERDEPVFLPEAHCAWAVSSDRKARGLEKLHRLCVRRVCSAVDASKSISTGGAELAKWIANFEHASSEYLQTLSFPFESKAEDEDDDGRGFNVRKWFGNRVENDDDEEEELGEEDDDDEDDETNDSNSDEDNNSASDGDGGEEDHGREDED
eukprot:5758663-Prymnesium_polylepis.2